MSNEFEKNIGYGKSPTSEMVGEVMEQRELDLTNPEDLDLFLESVEDIYADTFQYSEIAEKDDYKQLGFEDVVGVEVFETVQQKFVAIQEMIDKCRFDLAHGEDEIESSRVESMQQLHNDLVVLRDHVQSAYTYSFDVEEESNTEEQVSEDVVDPINRDNFSIDNENKSEVTTFEVVKTNEEPLQSPVEPLENLVSIEYPTDVGASILIKKVTSNQFYVEAEREAEWLSVCGLRVPVSGVEGVPAARALREGLMIARDRHREFFKHPEKVILVDKLIRKLANIPKEGLAPDEVSEVLKIARSIDVAVGLDVPKTPVKEISVYKKEIISPSGTSETVRNDILPQRISKAMDIKGDDEMNGIPISFTNKVAKNTEKILGKETASLPLEDKNQTPTPTSSLAQIISGKNPQTQKAVSLAEQKDPIDKIVLDRRPTIVHPKMVHEERSLTREYLNDKKYASFLRDNFTSPVAFERILDVNVAKIENQSVDALERWLGEKHVSPFVFMQDMTASEIEYLNEQSNIREILAGENIKYDTYVTWVDLLPEMKEVVGNYSDMKFGELYARWMIGSLM